MALNTVALSMLGKLLVEPGGISSNVLECPALDAEISPLLNLPGTVLEQVLLLLDASDVVSCGRTCTQLRKTCSCDGLWQLMCRRNWGTLTTVEQWVPAKGDGLLRNRELEGIIPSDYRSLYRMLSRYQELVGLWRSESPRAGPSLISLEWTPSCIEAVRLSYSPVMSESPKRVTAHCLGQWAGFRVVDARLVDRAHCALRVYHVSSAGGAAPPNAAAEAAAAVAVASSSSHSTSPDESTLGTSPVGSFEYEMLRFMQANVQGKGHSRRRRSSRNFAVNGGLGVPSLHHLTRVERPPASAKHPLAGLWKACVRGGPMQVLLLRYDFSGPAARIVATPMTGPEPEPMLMGRWVAAAAPLPQPLHPADVALIETRNLLADPEDAKEVVGCYAGQGELLLGDGMSTFVDGRLWAYAGGDMGFVWLGEVQHLQDMRRIDADVGWR